MSIFEKICIHSYCMFVGVFAMAIFMQAFFPIILKTGYHANINDIPSKIDSEKVNLSDLYHSHVDRVILLVIDALRVDFINDSKSSHNMPYTKMLVNEEEAFILVGHVHTPTVTMPRIKAMTTGTIPSFVDIINNLGSNSIEEDNLILQAESANKPVIFYGDETWLKLFPTSFKRKEGTTSFFVTDFIEVDNNVTRHLDNELRSKDWMMMILHYLGLDHIGHLEGPRSPHVKPKLQEMDSVIKKIHHKMKEWMLLANLLGIHKPM